MMKYSKDDDGWERVLLELTVEEGDISGDKMDPDIVDAVLDTVKSFLKKHKISTIKGYSLYLHTGSHDVCWGHGSTGIELPKNIFWNTVRRFLIEARAFRFRSGAVYCPEISWYVGGSHNDKWLVLNLRDEKVQDGEEE